MNLTNNLHPESLFKFVNLRQSKASKPDVKSSAGITIYSGTGSIAKKNKAGSNNLYLKLESKKGSSNIQHDILAETNSFKKQVNHLASVEALQNGFPELIKMIDYLDGYGNAITQKGVVEKFKLWSGLSIENYATTEKYNNDKKNIWDNILAQVILPDPNTPLTQLCKTIGAINVIDKISTALKTKEKKELSSKEVYDAYHVQPLIPEWIVVSMMAKPEIADSTVNAINYTAPDKTTKLNSDIKICTQVIKELKSISENKLKEALVQQTKKNIEINEILSLKLPKEQEEKRIQGFLLKFNALNIYSNLITEKEEKKLPKEILAYLMLEYTSLKDLDINTLINNQVQLSLQLFADLGATWSSPEIFLAGTLINEDGTKCQHYNTKPYCDSGRQSTMPFISKGSFVNAMIVGDLLVTKQQLLKYDTGEVAHIENILAGESKTRTHRNLDRTEVTTIHESETENETLRDTQTTERFSMEKEVNKVLSTDFNINAGVTASADYGTYKLDAYLNGGYSSSTQESNKKASKFSKDVTDRTLQRVKTIVREMQTVNILKETEETNIHKLKNPSPLHINGVYKWVDKFYLNRIINYGRRCMLEFQIPEPANFYLFRNIQNKLNNDSITKPIEPDNLLVPVERDYKIGLTSPNVLTDYNYTFWASYYGAIDVEAPPALNLSFSTGFSSLYGDPTDFNAAKTGVFSKDIAILPEGYKVIGAKVLTHHFNTVYGSLGNNYFSAGASSLVFSDLDNHTKQIGLALFSQGALYDIVITLNLKRTDELFQSWQLSTYGKVIDAYQQKLSEYNDWLNSQNTNNILIEGDNPGINRQIESTELKKRCLEMFSGQRFEGNDAAVDGIYNLSGYPEILFKEAIREGNIAKFFEHAFEWENMAYIFYDYFYARKSKWLTLTKLDDKADPLFKKFLQAGNARVNVPVRPGYEKLVMLFHSLSNWITSVGCGWNFDPQIFGQLNLSTEFSPGIENATYISIAEELKAASDLDDYGTLEKDPVTGAIIGSGNILDVYIQKVPTNLVYLANGAGPYPDLPDNTGDSEIQDVMGHFGLL
jgi:hypothetical protein